MEVRWGPARHNDKVSTSPQPRSGVAAQGGAPRTDGATTDACRHVDVKEDGEAAKSDQVADGDRWQQGHKDVDEVAQHDSHMLLQSHQSIHKLQEARVAHLYRCRHTSHTLERLTGWQVPSKRQRTTTTTYVDLINAPGISP